jgi:hypothetical protein
MSCTCLQTIYYLTNTFRDRIHMTHINSYMFRYRDVIFRGRYNKGAQFFKKKKDCKNIHNLSTTYNLMQLVQYVTSHKFNIYAFYFEF